MSTLLSLINQLPKHAHLSSTPDFKAVTRRSLNNVTPSRARTRIVQLALQDREAELSTDGKTISVYGAVKFCPWPAFSISYPHDHVSS